MNLTGHHRRDDGSDQKTRQAEGEQPNLAEDEQDRGKWVRPQRLAWTWDLRAQDWVALPLHGVLNGSEDPFHGSSFVRVGQNVQAVVAKRPIELLHRP